MEGANPFKQQAAEEKKRKQAQAEVKEKEAKAKAAHKLAAKKKQSQAVEDEWLNDGFQEGDKESGEESEEEHMGFQVFAGTTSNAGQPAPSLAPRQSKIVNLIDFGECETQEDSREPSPAPEAPSQLAALADPPFISPPMSGFAADQQGFGLAGAEMDPEGLLAELEHLQQVLSDAKEENSIQVAIKDDEIAEKQQMVDDLSRQLDASREKIRELEETLQAEREVATAMGDAVDATLRMATERSSPSNADVRGELLPPASDSLATASAVPAATAKLLAEAKALCEDARLAIQPGIDVATAQPPTRGSEGADASLNSAEEAGGALADLRGAVATLRASVLEAAASKPAQPTPPTPPSAPKADDEPLEVKAVNALREMRLNAERQLAWIAQRRADFEQRERSRLNGSSAHAEAAGAA